MNLPVDFGGLLALAKIQLFAPELFRTEPGWQDLPGWDCASLAGRGRYNAPEPVVEAVCIL